MAEHSHVPKFGNWDDDNIPYTAYFENARKEKTSGNVVINPNDPEQNPEAFMNLHRRDHKTKSQELDLSFGQTPHNLHSVSQEKHRKNIATHKRNTSGSAGNSNISSSEGYNNTLSASTGSQQHRKTSDNTHHRAASIPKFGAWDEADVSSGEDFSVVFNRVKEEKHIASTTFPSRHTHQSYSSHEQSNHKTSSTPRSKFCCCPFPCGRK